MPYSAAIKSINFETDIEPMLVKGYNLRENNHVGQPVELVCVRHNKNTVQELRVQANTKGGWDVEGREFDLKNGASTAFRATGSPLHKAFAAAEANLVDKSFDADPLLVRAAAKVHEAAKGLWSKIIAVKSAPSKWASAIAEHYRETAVNLLLKNGWRTDGPSMDDAQGNSTTLLTKTRADGTTQRLAFKEHALREDAQGFKLPAYTIKMETESEQGGHKTARILTGNGLMLTMVAVLAESNRQHEVCQLRQQAQESLFQKIAERASNPASVYLAAVATDDKNRQVVEVRELGQKTPLTTVRLAPGATMENFKKNLGAHLQVPALNLLDERKKEGAETVKDSLKRFADSATITGIGRALRDGMDALAPPPKGVSVALSSAIGANERTDLQGLSASFKPRRSNDFGIG